MSTPITDEQARRATVWLKSHFGKKLAAAVAGTAFTVDHLCGIACQETAVYWLGWTKKLEPDEISGRCVLDGSGDYKPEENPRTAFPRNTAELRARYDAQHPGLVDMLVAEGNKTRALRGLPDIVSWVYKGYGIFQYDLQFIEDDLAFFRDKLWYSFDECLARAMKELRHCWQVHHDVRTAIRAYNGKGPRAETYAMNVMSFTQIASAVSEQQLLDATGGTRVA
jgi:hypothetical protein